MLSILTQFQSNRSQHIMVDGCRSNLDNFVSRVPQSSVLGPLLFLLYTSEHLTIFGNYLIGYCDDSPLIAVVLSPCITVPAAESPNHDLVKVSERCDLWRMKLNASKTRTMIVPGLRAMYPQSPP